MFNKTFFILCPSYHGATLLSKLLNAHPDITALGDTYPSNYFDQVCGCGQRVSACEFWRYVKERVNAERYQNNRMMLQQYPGDHGGFVGRVMFSDFLSFWATPNILQKFCSKKDLHIFREDYESFLAAVYEKTPEPGRVFVDGVKVNFRMAALRAAKYPVDGVIHLHRNPVDFVGSSMNNTKRKGLIGAAEHAVRHRLYHSRARQVQGNIPCINLSYDCMAENIDVALDELFRFLDVTPMKLAELREYFDQKWHFMGNSSMFKFDGHIRVSRHALPDIYKMLVTMLAG